MNQDFLRIEVCNTEIAKIVFLRLYKAEKYKAAAKVARDILNDTYIMSGIGEDAELIRRELEMFPVRLTYNCCGNVVSFNLNTETYVCADDWDKAKIETL